MNLDIEHKLFNEPFPHLIIENFLSENQQKEILNEILEVEKSNIVKKVMDGRFQFPINLFKTKSLSKKLFNFFNTKETFELIKKKLIPSSLSTEFSLEFNEYNNFSKKEYFYQKFFKKIFAFIYKKNYFLHMDFSVAKNNYFREPHHDKETRIINFLLYLNTTENDQGGSLEIYKFKDKKNYDRFPKLDEIQIEKKIEPKGGKLVAFLSCPNSIHGVEKFEPKNDEKRVFAYGSYTSFFNVNWLKGKDIINK